MNNYRIPGHNSAPSMHINTGTHLAFIGNGLSGTLILAGAFLREKLKMVLASRMYTHYAHAHQN